MGVLSQVPSSSNERPLNVPDYCENFDGLPRKQLVHLLGDGLRQLGLNDSANSLEKESGVTHIDPNVIEFFQKISEGDWKKSLLLLFDMGNLARTQHLGIQFLILEQKYLEAIYDRKIELAVEILRKELEPCVFQPQIRHRMHVLAGFLMCEDTCDLWERTGWDHDTSRTKLFRNILQLLPKSMCPPAGRLAVLLRQAQVTQELHCLYPTIPSLCKKDKMMPSLLTDIKSDKSSVPTKCVGRLDKHMDEVWFVAISSSGDYIASSSKDKTVMVWLAEPSNGGPAVMISVLMGHSEACSFISWSPNDDYIATGSNDRSVRIWEPINNRCVTICRQHTESVTAVVWLKDSQRFLSAGFDKAIYLWNVNGEELYRWAFPSRIQDCGLTSDYRRLLIVNSDRHIKMIDMETKGDIGNLPEMDPITSISPAKLNNDVLVNVTQAVPEIRLWSTDGRRMIQKFTGHAQGRFVVRSCFGGPKEQYVISGSEDSKVYIWHRHHGVLLESISGHQNTVNCVAWHCSATHCLLVSCADDNTVCVWAPEKQPEDEQNEEDYSVVKLPPLRKELVSNSPLNNHLKRKHLELKKPPKSPLIEVARSPPPPPVYNNMNSGIIDGFYERIR